MKSRTYIVWSWVVMVILSLSSCKQNNWLDWKVQNELWLQQNLQSAGVQKTASGLQYRIIADPTPQDARPNRSSLVVCDYTVHLINGYQVSGGNSVALDLRSTIPGFSEGCHLIHNNGDIELFIPCYLGYNYESAQTNDMYGAEGTGTEGTQGFIPPYSTLIYKVHICGVAGD